ncbi:MAG: DUF1501 domain-containing protein [Pseudomonadota bacterium]
MTFSPINRRGLLRGIGAIGCSAAAFPLMTNVTFASAPWDGRLVVIILRGAMDGLDVLRPTGDADFGALRSSFGSEATELDGFFSLHKGLSDLLPLWQAGDIAFAHAVSTPYRDQRSHFDGQDMLEAGTTASTGIAGTRDGWLNRLLQVTPGIEAETGFAIGRENLRILSGSADVANWSPETRLNLGASAEELLTLAYQDDPLFRNAAAEAIALSKSVDPLAANGQPGFNRPERAIATFAADRMRGDTRIVSFSLNGWDTHRAQKNAMSNLLARLSDTILTLKRGLGDTWFQTTVLAVTEFGRTARENGSGGTDHGTAGAMLLAGGAVRGGRVYGRWPGLSEADLYDRRDLMPTADVRAYVGSVMHALLRQDKATIERSILPGVELRDAPNVIL